MKILKPIILLIIIVKLSYSQNDSFVKYDFGFEFKPGIYLQFTDFKNNSPIPFESLIYPDFSKNDFYHRLDTASTIIFNDERGVLIRKSISDVFGFSKNGKPYIYWSKKSNLIPFVGSISHFICIVDVIRYANPDPFYNSFYYNPYYYSPPNSRAYHSEELKQYFIDMETGDIKEYNLNNIENIFKREPTVYNEFSKLTKRKKKKQLFYFVRLYNEKRTLFLPE